MKIGSKHTKRTRKLMSLAKKGRKLPDDVKEKVTKTLRHGFGKDNPNWKGGRVVSYSDKKTKNNRVRGVKGYILLRLPNHPKAYNNRYYPEHRYAMEQKLGRILSKNEHIHHINGIKDDNRIENLELVNAQTHNLITQLEIENKELKARILILERD